VGTTLASRGLRQAEKYTQISHMQAEYSDMGRHGTCRLATLADSAYRQVGHTNSQVKFNGRQNAGRKKNKW
jgi:hypothetical protein